MIRPATWPREPQLSGTLSSSRRQVHFFPAIVNQKEIERLFVEKGCAKL